MKYVAHNNANIPVFNVRGVRFSLYNNIIVIWDEDFDTRVLQVLDLMPSRIHVQLATIAEHEGTVELTWYREIPQGYEDTGGHGIDSPDGDWWAINRSELE